MRTDPFKSIPSGGSDNSRLLATGVNLLDIIHYKLQLSDDGTTVTIHGEVSINGVPKTPPTDPILTPYNSWKAATFYFKAGCYYANEPVSGAAKVTFSSLSATHAP